ncbi:hypothetical protein B0H19DRAFT_178539 [Mycena capillaripes]|nr:hypothetical protein B0H19DRAFT_178539 [Mycena capillaripes]
MLVNGGPCIQFPPHPLLQTPTLFIGPLPSHVLETHIEAVFQGPNAISASITFLRTKNRRNRGALRSQVDFSDLYSAEKALAILHERPIPSLEPPMILQFNTIRDSHPVQVPDASVLPRLIMTKTLPSGCTEEKLYDLLRPYGPIYSVRIHPIAGGLVQFWFEAHARDAEIQLASGPQKMVLHPYDPCSLFFSNLSLALDETALRTHFDGYGKISSVEIFTSFKTGKSQGRGFITFSLASEAYRAMQEMHGREIDWKLLSVKYRLLGLREKRTAQAKSGIDSSVYGDNETIVEDAFEGYATKASSEPAPAPSKPAAPPASEPASAPPKTPDFESSEWTTPKAATQANADVHDSPPRDRELEAAYLKLKSLEALYDAEMKHRSAVQAENKHLREELETVQRALEVSESRLKMLQLERDRPLWEAAAKKREEEERRRTAEFEESRRKMKEFQEEENERKRAKEAERKEHQRREAEERQRTQREQREEERKAKQERERKAKEERERKAKEERERKEKEARERKEKEARERKEKLERERKEKEERERKAKEAREKLEREKRWKAATEAEEERCLKRDEILWGAGVWKPARALHRLKIQIDEFEKIKFSETQPMTFRVVPWPVLTDPLDLDIEEINWGAVEAFFASIKVQLAANITEYNALVEKVHRLFHPDKWKARNLLVTVMDDNLRSSLETTGNIVAQAMTPLWRKSKGYTT